MAAEQKNYYQLDTETLLRELKTRPEGLNKREIKKRQQSYGRNELKEKRGIPLWLLFLSQFKELLIIILILGGIVSYIIGNYRDGSIIFFIVIVNASIGFHHENKASRIIDRLKNLIKSPAKVMRGGSLMEIRQEDLVPGDIVRIDAGDKIPADLRLLESHDFKTSDFALTGESVPQEKHAEAIREDVSLADRLNLAYAGTIAASGSATAVVVATGMNTETGRIAGMVENTEALDTPLQNELRRLANQLTVAVVVIGVALFVVGMLQHFSIYMSLVYALGVAMAMVPQALPAQVTVALSTGSNQLADLKAVVKSLPSVETLGSTTVICTDKTGTLTKNEMTVQSLWFNQKTYEVSGIGYEPVGEITAAGGAKLADDEFENLKTMLQVATMASNAKIHEPDHEHPSWYPIGDPTEAALITLASKAGSSVDQEDEEFPELQEFAFDGELMRMSAIRKFADGPRLAVKGSTSSLLEISSLIYRDGESLPLDDEERRKIMEVNEEYSRNGMRVLAFGSRQLDGKEGEYSRKEVENELVFLGLAAMIDPPKEGVKKAIADARAAHIRVFILTGDHHETAQAVGRAIGLQENRREVPVVTGKEFKEMPENQLLEMLAEYQAIIFARVDPEDKLRIVELLEEQGEIVAVTGDGVNDAPALRKAHIGVAMGQRGNDVAKEAARLVLLDDNFSTLVHAIRGGRTIYDNLRKTVLASLTTNVAELVLVLIGLAAAALWGYPIPILAGQILAVDLLGEIGPLTLLTVDPPDQGVMGRKPRNPKAHLLTLEAGLQVSGMGALIGALAFINFYLFMDRSGKIFDFSSVDTLGYMMATAMSYTTIVFCQYVNIMEYRSPRLSLVNRNFFTNRPLLLATGVSIALVMVVIYAPLVSDFLAFGPLALGDWLYVLAAALFYLMVFESLKLVKRLSTNKRNFL